MWWLDIDSWRKLVVVAGGNGLIGVVDWLGYLNLFIFIYF